MSEKPNQHPEQSLNITDSVLKNVQIGGVAGRDLSVTQIQGGVGVVNVFSTVQVPQAPLSEAKPLSRDEYRWRQVLLSKVQQFWIDGVLAKSLHTQVLIEMGLEDRSDYIGSLFDGVEEFTSDTRQVFSAGTSATDIFEDIGAGRTLLILGEPGAGKTVTLLKLAKSLVARTSEDFSQPLPVVLNLSSWAKRRKSIDEWLTQELWDTYKVSKSLGKAWVDKEQLTLLLDGLDEVDVKHRNSCVQALNQFIQTHGRTEMVVCSRINDYEALSNKLSLRSALYVQPLTPKQIDGYLEQAGQSFVNLRSIFSQNPGIKAFASSPLILSIMSLAYQDSNEEDFSQSITSEAFRQRLFDAYIKRMFQRRGNTQIHNQKQEKRWLIWLAQYMVQNSQTIFLVERMQPSSFQAKFQRIRYQLESAVISGLIFGLVNILIYWPFVGLYVGLHNGLLHGLLGGLGIGFLGNIKTVETIRWSSKEAWTTSLNGLISGLISGLMLGLLFWLVFGNITGLMLGLMIGLPLGLLFGLIGGLISGIRVSEVALQKKTRANQGLLQSACNALIFGLLFGLFGGFFGGLLDVFVSKGMSNALIFGLLFGPFGGLLFGGAACIQHFILRLALHRMGHIPWNYARFLDYAADRLFLQKVGGGYIFIHRTLLEHFSSMELEPQHGKVKPYHE